MPKSVKNNPVTVGKRKEGDAAANKKSGPPKKKCRKKRCSAEGCTNHAQNGGVCIKHGATWTKKICSSEGCKNQARRGGVCMKHGAKVKLCTAEGCTKYAVNGGVCVTHGATVKRCSVEGCKNQRVQGGLCGRHGATLQRCSTDGCTKYAQNGGVCVKHGAKRKECSAEGCTKQAQRRGVCKKHGAYSESLLCQVIQGGGNQENNLSTAVAEVSDNEGEGAKKQHPTAARKRKAKGQEVRDASEPTRRSKRLSTLGRTSYHELEGNEMEEEKEDWEEDTSSDVAQTQEGEGGPTEAMGDSDHWGDDCQNEFNFESEDNGDANSEEGKHSHVVPEEITTTANDVGKERELHRLTSELDGSKKQVVNLEGQLKEVKSQSKSECEQLQSRLKQVEAQHEEKFQVAAELKEENRKLGETVVNLEGQLNAVKSQSKSEYEQLQSRLKQVEAQHEEKFQVAAELEEELMAQRAQKNDLDSQLMNAVTARLKERKDKDAVNRKLGGMEEANFLLEDQKKKLTDELCGAKAQLEAKSDTVAKLNAEVALQSSKEKEISEELQEARKDLEKEKSLLWNVRQEFWNVRQELKRMFAKLCGTKSELKAKSDSEAEKQRKIDELTEQNSSLRDQLEKQSEGGSAVKEEELTDDEDIATRWKERGTGRDPINEMIMNQKVDFAVLEAQKREVELGQALAEKDKALAEKDKALAEKDEALAEKDEALAEKEEALAERDEALAETEELRRQLRFKVKNSPRVRRHDSLTKLSDDRER